VKPEPQAGRYKRPELQAAYEDGFAQEYDHDAYELLDHFSWMLDDAPGAEGVERMAAALEGAADALHALAKSRLGELPTYASSHAAGL
jgi:hypothetical protein